MTNSLHTSPKALCQTPFSTVHSMDIDRYVTMYMYVCKSTILPLTAPLIYIPSHSLSPSCSLWCKLKLQLK